MPTPALLTAAEDDTVQCYYSAGLRRKSFKSDVEYETGQTKNIHPPVCQAAHALSDGVVATRV